MGIQDLDEIDVGPRRLKQLMVASRTPHSNQVDRVRVIHEVDAMRHSRDEKMRFALDPTHVDEKIQAQSRRIGEPHFDGRGLGLRSWRAGLGYHLSMNQSREGLKAHALGSDALQKGKPGRAPRAISAELRLAAVGVEQAPPKMCAPRPLDEDEPVPTDRETVRTDLRSQTTRASGLHDSPAVVDEDEIVPTPGQFHKRYRPVCRTRRHIQPQATDPAR